MPPQSKAEQLETQDLATLINEACARNTVIELHRRENHDLIPAARGRMMVARQDTIFVAEPQIIGRDNRLHVGQRVDAFFACSGVILQFETEILSTDETVRLNNQKRVRAYMLSAPKRVTPGQRRGFFRTLVLSEANIGATLRHVPRIDPIQCSIVTPAFVGTVVDASPLGFGINIPNVSPSRLKVYDNYFLTFSIPGTMDKITTLAELRQSREIPEINATRVGLMMVPWPSRREHTLSIQPLLRWLNEIQRRTRRVA